MSLIKSISGFRGTIGGSIGMSLTPFDVVSIASAFGSWCLKRHKKDKNSISIVLGRDTRKSGSIISSLVSNTLQSLGINVVDIGITTTPTLSIAVIQEKAHGGIMITASHNPSGWNALKLFNENGECICASSITQILETERLGIYDFATESNLGSYQLSKLDYIEEHIKLIMALPIVATHNKLNKFKVALDGVNSTGGVAIPKLLHAFGINKIIELNCIPNGDFTHNPEPLPHNLVQLQNLVKSESCDLGIAVDPDVDRLTIIDENGNFWGEEYTLVISADYVLKNNPGHNTVSNLSSTNALNDVTITHGGLHYVSPVGEAHVVAKMKEINAIIGGEGNGGVIYPELHFGRDALIALAIVLTYLGESKKTASQLRSNFPDYYMNKHTVHISDDNTFNTYLNKIKNTYKKHKIITEDGLKILFEDGWILIRKSNTEPIIRVFTEAKSLKRCEEISSQLLQIFFL